MSNFKNGHALIIGVGADLPVTVVDATAIKDILINPNRAAYLPENVTLLTENEATRSFILQAFDELIAKVEPDDTVIIYYSGHGGFDKEDNEYYLVPFGFKPNNRAGTGITANEFSKKIKEIKSQKLVTFLDCCHAGGMSIKKDIEDSELLKYINENEFVEKTPIDFITKLDEGGGRIFIASSKANEYSIAAKPYSIFTECLIKALAGEGSVENNEGYAKILDITGYLLDKVPLRSEDFPPYKESQHPIVKYIEDLDDNFPICYYAGGQKKKIGTPLEPAPVFSDSKDESLTIYGVVYEMVKGTRQPVRDAKVKIPHKDSFTRTNIDGNFILTNVPKDTKKLDIRWKDNDEVSLIPIREDGIYEFKEVVFDIELLTPEEPTTPPWKIILPFYGEITHSKPISDSWTILIPILVIIAFVSLCVGYLFIPDSGGTIEITSTNTPYYTPTNTDNGLITQDIKQVAKCGDKFTQPSSNLTTNVNGVLKPFYNEGSEEKEIYDLAFSPTIYAYNSGNLIEVICLEQNESFTFNNIPNDSKNVSFWFSFSPSYLPKKYQLNNLGKLQIRKVLPTDNNLDDIVSRYADFAEATNDWDTANYSIEYLKKRFSGSIDAINNKKSYYFTKSGYDEKKADFFEKRLPIFKDIVDRIDISSSNKFEISDEYLDGYVVLIKNDSIPLQIRKDAIKSFIAKPRSISDKYNEYKNDLINYFDQQISSKSRLYSQAGAALISQKGEKYQDDFINNIVENDSLLKEKLTALSYVVTDDSSLTRKIIAKFEGLISSQKLSDENKKMVLRGFGLFTFNNNNSEAMDKLFTFIKDSKNNLELRKSAFQIMESVLISSENQEYSKALTSIKKEIFSP